MVLARIGTMEVRVLNNLQLNFSNLKFENVDPKHINKMPFSGICLKADTPSDGIPYGSDKPVAFSTDAINKALETFNCMGVNCVYDGCFADEALTGHDNRFKIGVVEQAELNSDGVLIKGDLWQYDFQDVCFQIKNAKDSLGFSVEVVVNQLSNKGEFYLVDDFTFTGVAILYKNLAAFKTTQLTAKSKKDTKKESDVLMNEEQFKQFMDGINAIGKDVKVELNLMNEKLEKLKNKENKVDFAEVTEAIKSLGSKFEEPKQEEIAPEKKTENMAFVGKGKEESLSLSEQYAQIDNDNSIPFNLKAQRKMEIFKQSLNKNN